MAEQFGQYGYQDALNRCMPIANRVKLGDTIQALINGVNGLATAIDNSGIGASATVTATTGGTINAGDTYTLTVLNPSVAALVSPGVVVGPGSVVSGDTLVTIAAAIARLVNASAPVAGAGLSATASSSIVVISQPGTIGNSTTITSALKAAASVTVTMGNGGVLANGTLQYGGGFVAKYRITNLADRA